MSKPIIFLNGKSTIEIEPPSDQMTTMCRISLKGKSECDLKLVLPGVNSMCLTKGQVNFWKNYEWYDGAKTIKLEKLDDCNGDADLRFGYSFSKQYFGKGVGEGFEKCDI